MNKISLDELLENIQDTDVAKRAAARDEAGSVGAPGIPALAEIAAGSDFEVARAANRAMQNIVYHAGRPGAEADAKAVAQELLKLLGDSQPTQFRRDVLWMTWQIAGEEAVSPVAALLANGELHEDARMALERLPGNQATAELKKALANAPDAQKPALAHSLRVRGVDVPGVPDLRLTPTRDTSVKPVGRE